MPVTPCYLRDMAGHDETIDHRVHNGTKVALPSLVRRDRQERLTENPSTEEQATEVGHDVVGDHNTRWNEEPEQS